MSGRVYLVGAGPGDPGLLTVRGAQILGQADVVLYDALVNPALLQHVGPNCRCELVGKRHGRVAVAQTRIEEMMTRAAAAGSVVVRLKGGDPFLFGRGGEEATACSRAGIPFEVVPGVSSAGAVPAYAGIPLTHRDHASSVTIITGRAGGDVGTPSVDWQAAANIGGTLVFLMAMTSMREICGHLLQAGMPASTPAAAIRWGTLPRQQVVRGTLGDIAEAAERTLHRPPVVFVVGGVAALADSLAWYQALPLFGRRIVVTRARHQAADLAERLERLGAWVVEYPTISIDNVEIPQALLDDIGGYDWLVLTSVNGVERFFAAYLGEDRDVRDLAGVRIAAIGPATAGAVNEFGLRVEAMPQQYQAEALLEVMGEVSGSRVLLARAAVARDVLPDGLRERGAEVDVVSVYQTEVPSGLIAFADLTPVDMVTFTSSSTAQNFAGACGGDAKQLLAQPCVAAIGPITAATLQRQGTPADIVADSYTIDGLCRAVVAYFANRQSAP